MKPVTKCGLLAAVFLALLSITTTARAQAKKPNILVILGR